MRYEFQSDNFAPKSKYEDKEQNPYCIYVLKKLSFYFL